MAEWFDRLAKMLAGGGSRRDALKFLGGVLGGGLLAGFAGKARADEGGEDKDDDKDDGDNDNDNDEINETCRKYCHGCPHHPEGIHGKCIRSCKKFLRSNPKGATCGTCTAKNPFTGCVSGATCCTPKGAAAFCTNTNTDAKNCGACGNVCATATPTCCAGKCVDTQTDVNNCGKCGTACTSSQKCTAGVCK
jgi:hypothetical protein